MESRTALTEQFKKHTTVLMMHSAQRLMPLKVRSWSLPAPAQEKHKYWRYIIGKYITSNRCAPENILCLTYTEAGAIAITVCFPL